MMHRLPDVWLACFASAVRLHSQGAGLTARELHEQMSSSKLGPTALAEEIGTLPPESPEKSQRAFEGITAKIGRLPLNDDYIDGLIMAQFTSKLPEGLMIGSIWELAAARRTPEIEAAANAYNREAYERKFLRKSGRPVENWIFNYIPPEILSYVRPPLNN